MNGKNYDFRNETGTWQTGRTQPPKRYSGLIAFLIVLACAIVYTIIVVPGTVICSMLVAALITSRKRTRFTGFVKSAMFIPVISSSVLKDANC